ncbi:hypothetical protein GCM10010423_57970 [Streptomyces levis]|uniref:Uncharacterized protein n=1 Tax=Streptomyces levis TaxID=285566 RepID=A0ABN3NZ23_9ACTN
MPSRKGGKDGAGAGTPWSGPDPVVEDCMPTTLPCPACFSHARAMTNRHGQGVGLSPPVAVSAPGAHS